MKKALRIILIVLFAGVFLYSGGRLVMSMIEYRQAEQLYNEEREAVFHVQEETPAPSPSAGSDPDPDPSQSQEPQGEYFPTVEVDFDRLLAENPDVVGWIWVPGTTISYPLMQSADNDKYLRRSYNGVYNIAGSIFMDYRSHRDFTGENTVIYGHNMKNGAMFSDLEKFSSQEYFDANGVIYIYTAQATYKYRAFSSYVTNAYANCYTYSFGEGELEGYIADALAASQVSSSLTPTGEDRILLLSTCTSRGGTERFVLHAVLVAVAETEPGELIEG